MLSSFKLELEKAVKVEALKCGACGEVWLSKKSMEKVEANAKDAFRRYAYKRLAEEGDEADELFKF